MSILGASAATESGSRLLPFAVTVVVLIVPFAGQAAPKVTGVVNNYSFVPSGLPNSGVAPSSLITIFGSGMASPPTGNVTLESSAGPAGIPKLLNGTSISVTVGGTTVTPGMYYAIPSQIAAVLPANTPTGAGTLTVTYNGAASNAFAIQVVSSAFGLDTYFGTGSGLIVATNAVTGALFDYMHSAAPGEIITLWGTGLGADPEDSDTVFSTTPHAVNQASVQVYFGGVAGTVTYAGSSGYPGLDQINVTVPDPEGCNVSVTVVVEGHASNFPGLPITTGGGACSDPLLGISGGDLSGLSGQANVNSGAVFVSQTSSSGTGTTVSSALADFRHYPGGYGTESGALSVGSCIITEPLSAPSSTGLDAGTMTVKGSGGSLTLLDPETGLYAAQIQNASATPGASFVFNWTGGSVVGAGTVTVSLPNPFLKWTNPTTTVTRSQGIHVTWSGGSPGSFVIISGTSSPPGGSATGLVCYAAQSALEFDIPAYLTELLPAGTGSLGLVDTTPYQSFTASGLNHGTAWGSSGDGTSSVTYK